MLSLTIYLVSVKKKIEAMEQLFRHVGTQWKGSWAASVCQTSAGLECSNVNCGLILTIQPEVECKPKAYKWQHKETAKASESTLGSF